MIEIFKILKGNENIDKDLLKNIFSPISVVIRSN